MSDIAAIYSQPSDYDALIEAFVTRADELGISHNALDDIAGLTGGHAGKILGPSRVKTIGTSTLFLVLPALGLRLALLRDDETARRYRDRHLKRRDKQVRRGVFTHPPNARTVKRVARYLAETYSWRAILEAVQTSKYELLAELEAKSEREAAERVARELTKSARKSAKPVGRPRANVSAASPHPSAPSPRPRAGSAPTARPTPSS